MKLHIRSVSVLLLVLWSTSGTLAQTATTVRIVLPQEASTEVGNIANVLARQITERCDARVVTDVEAQFAVELEVAPGIGTDGFRIEDRPGGGVKISGDNARGLLYGVGKFLHTSRYDRGGFEAGAWRGTSIPEKPVRGIYFATHFHNYYHDAPIEDVQRYVEDVGLWGLNTLIVWYDMHHFNGFDSSEAVEFRKRLKAICGAARRVGMDVGFACVANEGYANSPTTLRADVTGMRGAAFPSDICTSQAEGSRYVLNNFAQLFDWAADLEPKWIMIWPYDSGGCGCAQCQPWGYGGYLRCAEPLAKLARSKFPGARVMLSTWFFNGDEWAGLNRTIDDRPDWVDYLLVEPAFLPGTPDAPPQHPAPADLPLVGFPEISMIGWPAWGGFGANPLPDRYEREWQELKNQWYGGCPYSEGIFEDINKVLFARFYWKADTTADEALREYIAFEYSPDVVDLVVPAIHILEKNVPSARVGPASLEARDLIEQADARLTPRARQAWRWRILYLRAQVDAQLYLNRGVMQGRVLHDAFEELTRIYHAHNAEPAVKPPLVDPADPPTIERPAGYNGPALASGYEQVVLSSKPIAFWRMSSTARGVLEDSACNARSATCEAGVECTSPNAPALANPAPANPAPANPAPANPAPANPAPANPAAVCWGGRISASVDQLPDTYSVELWVRNELPVATRPITAYFFSRGIDGPQGTEAGDNLGIGGTHDPANQGKLFFFNGTKHDKVLSGKTVLPQGTWHHIVFVRQNQNVSVYLDGAREPEISGQAEIGYAAGCGQLFLGGRNDRFAPLEGALDEVSLYDRALSADEVAAHYEGTQPRE